MKKRIVIAAFAGALLSLHAWSQDATPVGLWKTIDDNSGKPKALIRITEGGGEFKGTIEKLFQEPGQLPNPTCDKCEDARKDQPIIGMAIVTGMKKQGDEFAGGTILDPKNGKVYKSKMTLADGGKKLNVRGYIGMPMLGRTQVWVREE